MDFHIPESIVSTTPIYESELFFQMLGEGPAKLCKAVSQL